MSYALRKPNRVSEQEYLDFENGSALRHELVGGIIYAMVGGSDKRSLITGNMFAALHRGVSNACQVFTLQMKLRVQLDEEVNYIYPDVFVVCDPNDRASHHRERPCMIAEVISPSTERDDRRDKFHAYTRIESLQEYVLIAQDVPQMEVMRRRTAWQPEFLFLPDTLSLESLNLRTPVAEIYRRLSFVASAP